MSDILTKSGVPGSVAVPSTPGTPGIPAQPAYCVDVPTQVPYYAIYGGGIFTGWYPPGGDGIGLGTGPGGAPLPPPGNVGNTLVYGGTITVIDHTCYPAVAAVPPTPGTAPQAATPYDFRIGWNSGAVSIGKLSGDGEYQFSVTNPVVGVVSGLSQSDVQGAYQKIEFGIYFAGNKFQVVESGALVTGQTTFTSTDVFTIARVGTQVRYWQNSTLIYTSTGAAIGTVYATAALYMAGDAVNNALLDSVATAYAGVFATVAATLQQPVGFALAGGADLGGWVADIIALPVGASLASIGGVSVASTLQQPVGQAFANGFVEDCQGVLTQPVGYAEAGLLAPNYVIAADLLQSPSGFSWAIVGNVGNCAGILTQPKSFALGGGANLGGWEEAGTIPNPGVFASANGPVPNWFLGQASSYELFAQGHSGNVGDFGFYGELTTPYSLKGLGGAQGAFTIPMPTLSASGTTTTLGEAYLAVSPCLLMASATETTMGRAYLVYGGDYSLSAESGAIVKVALSGYSLNASGTKGFIGEVVVAIGKHHYHLNASGTEQNYGTVEAILPNLIMVPSGMIQIHGPRFTIVAHGSNDPTVTYEAYSHTLMGDGKTVDGVAVTHYTEYPFDRIVRFGTRYFGVAADGLYELAGNTFDGDAILSAVQFGESDFGEPSMKRTRHLYMAGRLSHDVRVSVFARENETDVYTYDPVLGGARNTRITLGRGLQARYLAFKIENLDGQKFELQEIGPEVDVLRRTA